MFELALHRPKQKSVNATGGMEIPHRLGGIRIYGTKKQYGAYVVSEGMALVCKNVEYLLFAATGCALRWRLAGCLCSLGFLGVPAASCCFLSRQLACHKRRADFVREMAQLSKELLCDLFECADCRIGMKTEFG
jgi:hypothetical protein